MSKDIWKNVIEKYIANNFETKCKKPLLCWVNNTQIPKSKLLQ